MKQLTYCLLAILLLTSCDKDTPLDPTPEPDPQPNYFQFDGSLGASDNSTIISGDNNLLLCGNNAGKISILKITKTGTQLWRKDVDAGSMSTASGIAELNGHIFVCGETFRNYATSNRDVLVVKTAETGDTVWTKTYGGANLDFGKNIIATSDGNLLISGRTESFGSGSEGDIYLIKINPDGDVIWATSYEDEGQETAFHLMETQNGEYLVTGTNEDTGGDRMLYLLKVGSTGAPVWNKKIGSASWSKWGYSTVELANGDLVTSGKITVAGFNKVLIVKTDASGTTLWEKELAAGSYISIEGKSIKQNSDGTFTITGLSFDIATSEDDIILMKVDANGNQLWMKEFGSAVSDNGWNLIKDGNGDNIITGHYSDRIFMTRTDNDGVFE